MFMERGNPKALLPIAVFVVLYLGIGILLEYVLSIPMGFYSVPVIVIFLVALMVACLQNRRIGFDEKLTLMGKGIGDRNIITMILIFLVAGVFVGVAGRESAESVAYLMLSIIPAEYAIVVLFIVSCFVSLAMGTSVGTVTLITPIAITVSTISGFSLPLCVATVIGGAMFGDNLSFISDTTIAACNGQGCPMKDKFRENLWIALPAAIATLALVLVISLGSGAPGTIEGDYDLIKIVPYILVLAVALSGLNVFFALIIGIVSASVIMLGTGAVGAVDLLSNMGSGASGMFETSMVAILVSAICALVKANGGFDAILYTIHRMFRSNKGGQLGIGLLVGAMDISTANNTVAIVMANPIAKDISESYGISPSKTASLLDTFSCIFQGIIPYGAQMLVALTILSTMGFATSAMDIIPYLFYPFLLLLSSLAFIFLIPTRDRGKGSRSG